MPLHRLIDMRLSKDQNYANHFISKRYVGKCTYTTKKRHRTQKFEASKTQTWTAAYWIVTPRCIVGVHKRFRRTYRLHLQET